MEIFHFNRIYSNVSWFKSINVYLWSMAKTLSTEAYRFRQIREELHFTQAAFADALEISASVADIERGRTRLSGQLVATMLERFNVNPLWLFGKSDQRWLKLETAEVLPRVVTVNDAGNENIVLVNAKAAAGYPQNIQDTSWYEQLPAFTIPLPEYRNASFRGFQVEGDSMLPGFYPNEWVVGQAVNSIGDVSDGAICVVVLAESVLLKKLRKYPDKNKLELLSLNTEYSPIVLEATEVQEVWRVTSKLTFEADSSFTQISLQDIKSEMRGIRNEIKAVRKDMGLG